MVSQNDIIIIDESAVLPGRGAWVHPTRECMDAALRRRAFGRALRVPTILDTQTIEDYSPRNKG
ncbi:YlxR family protein [Microbacterium sp. LWH10-1.2]|uniref:YlxR family protein n=1 Tax=Microbacterium sp. LWH10-1.2 TaxID=3135255 RepID=UPI00324982CF